MPSRPQVCGGTEIEMVVKITVGPKIVVGPKIERLVLQKLPAHLIILIMINRSLENTVGYL